MAVTGASGFLGQHVCAAVAARGRAVVAVPRDRDGAAAGDWLARVAPAAVIHCAAVVPRTPSDYDDARAAECSVALAATVAAEVRCRLVFVSSMTVYGEAPVSPVDERAPLAPMSAYARGKCEAEAVVAARRNPADVIVRLPGLFGLPRRSGLLFTAACAFLQGRPFVLRSGPGAWAAMAVEDAAEVLTTAALDAGASEPLVCNVGYAEFMSVASAVSQLARVCGVSWTPPVQAFPSFVMRLERAHRRLGWRPPSLESRLERFVATLRLDLALQGSDA